MRLPVTFNGEVIADSRDPVQLEEGDYPVVYYPSRKDVKMQRLVPRTPRDTLLAEHGVTGLDKYSVTPGTKNFIADFFVD